VRLLKIKPISSHHGFRGVTRGGKGAQFPGFRVTMTAPKSPNNVTSTFFSTVQYSTFASERPVSNMGRQICFLPRAPSNLVTPLHGLHNTLLHKRTLQCLLTCLLCDINTCKRQCKKHLCSYFADPIECPVRTALRHIHEHCNRYCESSLRTVVCSQFSRVWLFEWQLSK